MRRFGARSRHQFTHRVLRHPPSLGLHDRLEAPNGIPDVNILRVERREAKPKNIGRSEISYHTRVDQRLHHRPGVFMHQGDLAAALHMGERCDATLGSNMIKYRGVGLQVRAWASVACFRRWASQLPSTRRRTRLWASNGLWSDVPIAIKKTSVAQTSFHVRRHAVARIFHALAQAREMVGEALVRRPGEGRPAPEARFRPCLRL